MRKSTDPEQPLVRVQRLLAEVTDAVDTLADAAARPLGQIDQAQLARHALSVTKRRNEFFDDLIGEGFVRNPGLDLLLIIYLGDREEVPVSVSSACVQSGLPTTTALRWIRTLEDAGAVLRRRDGTDPRRSFLSLAPTAADKMAALLTAAVSTYGLPPI